MNGMMAAVAEKGYFDTTIADIVALARVSKRTFYECFENKEACFLACYEHFGRNLMQITFEAGMAADAKNHPWEERLAKVVQAGLEYIDQHRRAVGALLVQIHAIGPAGMRARRQGHQLLIELTISTSNQFRRQIEGAPDLSRDMAVAIIGGLNELMLDVIEGGRDTALTMVAESMTDFMSRALSLEICETPAQAVLSSTTLNLGANAELKSRVESDTGVTVASRAESLAGHSVHTEA